MIYWVDEGFTTTQKANIDKMMDAIVRLLPTIASADIELEIVCVTPEEHLDGFCDESANVDYEIGIDPQLDDHDFFFTLAHEMKHLEQMYEGRLQVDGDDFIWLGRRFKMPTKASYDSRPWEAEANLFEENVKIVVDSVLPPSYIEQVSKGDTTCRL